VDYPTPTIASITVMAKALLSIMLMAIRQLLMVGFVLKLFSLAFANMFVALLDRVRVGSSNQPFIEWECHNK